MEIPISNRKNIVVSADDFGLSARANRNILYLVSLGKIDRVAVMADGFITENEIRELVRSGVKLDIHLALRPSFADGKDGRSIAARIFNFLKDYLLGEYRTDEVSRGWKRQIEKFHALFGKYPDGINSHEHVHFFPPFFKLAIRLQEEYPIPYLRFGNESVRTQKNKTGFVLALLRKMDLGRFRASSFASSDHLASLDWITDLEAFLDNLGSGSTEIVCHPHRAEEFVLLKKNF